MHVSTLIPYGLLCAVLLAAAVSDVRTQKVPNKLTYPAILSGLALWPILALVTGDFTARSAFLGSLFAFFAAAIPFAFFFRMGGLGGGDVKLMAAVGAIGGSWQLVLSTTVYALLAAVAFGIVLMIKKRIVKQVLIRLGIALLSVLARKLQLPDAPDSPKVPFAVCIAIGGMLAGAEQLLGLHTPWDWLNP